MIYCCLGKACFCIDDNQSIVWIVTTYALDHGLGVLLISCHIYESKYFGALLHDLSPRENTKLALISNLPMRIESQNLLGNR
jgi:hypothetical protein